MAATGSLVEVEDQLPVTIVEWSDTTKGIVRIYNINVLNIVQLMVG